MTATTGIWPESWRLNLALAIPSHLTTIAEESHDLEYRLRENHYYA